MFKVIVAGGRDFNNYKGLSDSLDYLLKNINDDVQSCVVWLMEQIGLENDTQKSMDIRSSTSPPIGISMGSPQDSNGMSKWQNTQTLWLLSGTANPKGQNT